MLPTVFDPPLEGTGFEPSVPREIGHGEMSVELASTVRKPDPVQG